VHGSRQATTSTASKRPRWRRAEPRSVHTSAYVSIRQHTSAYVSIRQHTSAAPHQSGQGGGALSQAPQRHARTPPPPHARLALRLRPYVSMRQHTSAYVSTRQHTSAHVTHAPHHHDMPASPLWRQLRHYVYFCTSNSKQTEYLLYAPRLCRYSVYLLY
jgi:hypothetical protein